MSQYDGTWHNDPLDLRCIRLDAEMEEMCNSKPLKPQKRKSKPKYVPKKTKDQKRTHRCADGTLATIMHKGSGQK